MILILVLVAFVLLVNTLLADFSYQEGEGMASRAHVVVRIASLIGRWSQSMPHICIGPLMLSEL